MKDVSANGIHEILIRIEAGQRELLAELRRKRKGPRKRAATVARRALQRVASVPVSDIDIARAERILRQGGQRR